MRVDCRLITHQSLLIPYNIPYSDKHTEHSFAWLKRKSI
jgi:hypothetical protein